MKTKTLFTTLIVLIGLQLASAQNYNSEKDNTKNTSQTSYIIPDDKSDWDIVKYEGLQNDLFAIQFIDDNHGWAVGSYGTLIYTTNGGLTWKENNFGSLVDLYDVQFLDEKAGFIVGVQYVGPHLYGIAYKTVDGGLNWNLSFLSESPMVLNSVAFSDTHNGLLTGHSYGPVGTNAVIIKTADAGIKWESISVYNGIIDIDNIMFNNKGDFKGMTVAWATGRMNVGPSEVDVILKSVDLGENWNTAYTGNGGISLSDISFFDYVNGIAVGDNGTILLTNDAGDSWIAQKSDHIKYNATLAGEENNLWIVGDEGMILNSTEKGQNWVKQYTLFENDLNAICSTPGGNLWIAGSEGTLMKKQKYTIITEEKTQDLENNSSNGDLKQIQFSNQNEKDIGPLIRHKNYPNPIHSKSTISFEIDKQAHVIVDIYNQNGILIRNLKDQDLDPGYYEVTFDANGLLSGIYTYILRAGNQIESGKMIK